VSVSAISDNVEPMQTAEEAQKLLAQTLRAAGGLDEDFPTFWRQLDSEAREYIADVLAKSLVAMVGVRAEQRGGSADEAVEMFAKQIASGGLQAPPRRAGRHAAPESE
jgi:hypothetical protein